MDNSGYSIDYEMGKLTGMLGFYILAFIAQNTFNDEKEKVKAALGHEPTQEDWRDYCKMKQEQKNRQTARHREIDREKLRRLVFGEDSDNSKAK